MDEIGEIDPDEPDNIPDKYQVTFQYISEDPSYGTVSGKVKEVVTRPKNADGTYNMTAPVHPKAEVTVAGIGNYKFNRWSDGNTNYSAASEIAKAGFIADTTFTAYFSYSGGNSGGGSSGGGGGGPLSAPAEPVAALNLNGAADMRNGGGPILKAPSPFTYWGAAEGALPR